MSELKRCPFCGGEAMLTNQLSADEYGHKLWTVLCFDCGNRTLSYWDKEIVVEKWNTRKPIDRAIERLEEAYDKRHEQYMNDYDLVTLGRKYGLEEAIEILKEEVENE